MQIRIKRAYEPARRTDGRRVLIDGLWPRGVTKDEAKIDLWLKEIAPSKALRQWFGHDPTRWNAFRRRYFGELKKRPEAIDRLLQHDGPKTLTLVYGAKDEEHNNAVALKEFLGRRK